MTPDTFINTLYNLNVGCIGTGADRHERPHKPLMLLAALEVMDRGHTANSIPWNADLVSLFSERFNIVKHLNDDSTPQNPFFYMRSEGFWEAIDTHAGTPLSNRPLKKQFGTVNAQLSEEFYKHIDTPAKRAEVRDLLISRYFPEHRAALLQLSTNTLAGEQQKESKPARNSAFKHKIAELYDEQCAACGLRIKLPNHNVSFIDAAHLIPFSQSHNDHPSNGMALCKHHHWAMDRHLISPGPDGSWHVSNVFDKRRSAAESDLIDLKGTDIIQPNDEAFYPSEKALKWRYDQLLQK